MARRRMLDSDVIGQEKFIQMPGEIQALYMHLNNATDNDGFVQPLGILRETLNKIDSLKILIAKGFMLIFPGQWAVLRDFRNNNTISPSRRGKKERRPELALLRCVEGRYYLKTKSDLTFTVWLEDNLENDDVLYTDCIQLVAQRSNKEIKEVQNDTSKKEEKEENAEDSENTKKIRAEIRAFTATLKPPEPQG